MLEVLIHRRRPGTTCLLHVLYLRPTTWKRDTWHRPFAQTPGPSAEDRNAALQAHIDAEQRTASEIMRDTLTQYPAS